MNFNNKHTRTIISRVIIAVLVMSMILPILLSALSF